MKKLIVLFVLIAAVSGFCFAQTEPTDFRGRDLREREQAPQTDQMNFVPNEILVKFKDEVIISGGTMLKSAGISSVDQILKANGIGSLEKLFPAEKKLKSARIVKDPTGRDMKIPSLHNIYKISVPQLKSTGNAPANIFKFMEELKALPEVEYAEPNYIYSVDDLKPVGLILTADDVANLQNTNLKSEQTAVVPNDPLYSQQGYIPAVKADLVWSQTTGDTTQVIAILDTGVDWNHNDLKNKIWRNKAEIPGNGRDDDGNGLIDDIRGWDYINNDNNPTDDNSHGTHVAGIAAAESNNGIGIAGVNWKAKIMPIKVFPSTGYTDVATIVQGINYAYLNGATVINMSFGGYGRSLTMESSLLNAYESAFLVAGAGNDSYSIYDLDVLGRPRVFYPAAFPFVFGVQSDGPYSNYDPDGPVYSEIEGRLNYEVKAPGSAFSTVPDGNYRVLQGTSMATPMVAGAVSLYSSFFPQKTIEELWSDFIHASTGIIDLNNVFFGVSKPISLDLLNSTFNDSEVGCDKDGFADAGETIDLIVQVRNTGSPASNVYVKIKQSNDGDPRDITILKDSVSLGSIGIFRSLKNTEDPFKIKINTDCYNNRIIALDVTMGNKPNDPIFVQKIKFKIFNGEELSGILSRDTAFTPDKNWVITNSLRISQGITLTILPGTHVEINAGVDNRGKVVAIGSPENKISMKGIIGGDATYKYADIDMHGGGLSSNIIENCEISNLARLEVNRLRYSKISNLTQGGTSGVFSCDTIYRCYISNSYMEGSFTGNMYESVIENFIIGFSNSNLSTAKYNFFDGMKNIYAYAYPGNPEIHLRYPAFLFTYGNNQRKIFKNTFLSNGISSYFIKTEGSADAVTLPNQYWGTSNPDIIRSKNYDFWNNAGIPYLNYDPKLLAPSDSCHAHVWKVLVNGKDAQDEVVDPVGVGKQRFDVYFNREMNKSVTPRVTFGGLYPYLSNSINEEGTWSADGRIYTVYKTIKLTTGDGINRIRVSGARQATDWGWEIPIEYQRFEFLISAANSASLEFMASPGLGKVNLEWNNNDLADGLGFNMYRMEHVNDSVLTNPVLVNSMLITDTLFTDFSVVPNKKYYYYYKILRTNLSETDSSKVVAAIPFTAALGDANGDLSVNVLDVTTIVAYLLNQNPQPFIFEAADVNGDGQINVLDIVATVNKVLNPGKSASLEEAGTVNLYLQNDTLFADATLPVGAFQFDITNVSGMEEIEKLNALQGFETGFSVKDNTLRLIVYSLTGKTIAAGNHIPLLRLKKGSGITNMIMGDKTGSPLTVNYLSTGLWNLRELGAGVASLGQNYPNPFNKTTTIPVIVNEPVDELLVRIINITGQEVAVLPLKNPVIGENLLHWNAGKHRGMLVYKLEISRGGKTAVAGVKKMIINQ